MIDSMHIKDSMNIFSSRHSELKKINRSLGFTLIELLVVISIMAILMAMTAVSYTTAQQKGRDAKRRVDISSIQKGFEQYFAENAQYDSASGCGNMGGDSTHFPAGLPSDPKNSSPYTYSYRCSTTAYCVCARLEASGTGNSTAAASSTTCSFSSSGTLNYYCVSNLQ